MPASVSNPAIVVCLDDFNRLAECVRRTDTSQCSLDQTFQSWIEQITDQVHCSSCLWLCDDPNPIKLYLKSDHDRDHKFFHQNEVIKNWLAESLEKNSVVIQSLAQTEVPYEHVLLIPLATTANRVGIIGVFINQFEPDEQESDEVESVLTNLALQYNLILQAMMQHHFTVDYQRLFREYDAFTTEIHHPGSFKELSQKIVDQCRQFSKVDRCTFFLSRHGKLVPIAVSAVEKIDRESSQIKLLKQLSLPVLRSETSVVYDGKEREFADSFKENLVEYIQQSRVHYLQIEPIVERSAQPGQAQGSQEKISECSGVLIFEQFKSNEIHHNLKNFGSQIINQVALSLQQAIENQKIFLRPLWKMLGNGLHKFRYSTLLKTAIGVWLLFGVFFLFTNVSMERKVAVHGHLVSNMKSNVFAPRNCSIKEIAVESGQRVQPGDLLLVMEDFHLEAEINRVQDSLTQENAALQSLQAEQYQADPKTGVQVIQLQAEIAKSKVQIKSIIAELELLFGEKKKLRVTSTISGVVTDFQLKQKLTGKPVRTGEKLLEIMGNQGGTHLEVLIPESQIGYLFESMNNSGERKALGVEYRFVSSPDAVYQGEFANLPVANIIYHEQQPYLKSEIVQKKMLPDPRLGAEVSAHILCTPEPLYQILFRDFYRYLKVNFW